MDTLQHLISPIRRSIGKFSPTRQRNQNDVRREIRTRCGPNWQFLKNTTLTTWAIQQIGWMLPLTPLDNFETINNVNVTGDGKTKFSVANLSAYTNTKAMLSNAGQFGHPFPGQWRDVTNDDIRQFIGVMFVDGLCPEPKMTRKFWSQEQDATVGNDFIHNNLGPNAERRYHILHHFFGCQNPLTISPPQTECPNYKVNEFFNWLHHIWKCAWDLGPTLSTNKQGKSQYKTQCGKFKRIVDGIQADAIADDGYTWDFYFCNEPVPSKWLKKGLSPIHLRWLQMFENSSTRITLWTWTICSTLLYSLLTITAQNCKSKVMTQGVIKNPINVYLLVWFRRTRRWGSEPMLLGDHQSSHSERWSLCK